MKRISSKRFIKLFVLAYIFIVIFLGLAQLGGWEPGYYIGLGICAIMFLLVYLAEFPDEVKQDD